MTTATSQQQRVFSWDAADGHLFEVAREPIQRASASLPHPGYEWVCSATIARFYGPAQGTLLKNSIDVLKQQGWSWVDPA